MSNSKIHSDILQLHWNDEIAVLINSIQIIIDTQAFCTSIIEILTNTINNLFKSFDKEIAKDLLSYCDVLKQHFEINSNELALGIESPRSKCYGEFLLMIKECKSAVDICKDNEKDRIIKRFKILLSVLKKFLDTLKDDNEPKEDKVLTFGDVTVPPSKFLSSTNLAKTESMEVLGGETVATELFFESMGISASPTRKLLYESKREKSVLRKIPPKVVDSTFKMKANGNSMSVTPSRRVKKSTSTSAQTLGHIF